MTTATAALKTMMTQEFGILFDLDGVLIDSCELHWESWKLLQDEVPDFRTTKEEYLKTFGKRNDEIFLEKIKDIHLTPGRIEELSERKEALFRECGEGKIELLPGMEEFLQLLTAKKIKKIIASSTPRSNLNFFIQKTVLGNYFDDFVGGDMVPQGKPAPDIFLAAAKKIGLPPSQCIVIEDSPAGLRAGRLSGAFVIALATTHTKEDLQQKYSSDFDLLLNSPKDLGRTLFSFCD